MSQKWRRAKQWDNEHLTGMLCPVKWVLRTLSSITLAVITLTGIAVYGTLASVPIGLLAEIPTWAIYIGTLLLAVAAGVLLPVAFSLKLLRRLGVSASWRYAVGLLGSLGLAVGIFMLWLNLLWPHLRWNAATGEGLMLFPGFVESHRSTTLRRLPGFEMSELEFYGWWPMKALLMLLIVNLVVATVRRIEFIFVNIGVLTVHTGIVVIGIGSALYSSLKLEGDTVLFAGQPDESGQPTLGPPETGFYDNTDVALWIAQQGRGGAWQQRPLAGVPRYNDYRLDAAWPESAIEPRGVDLGRRALHIPVPPGATGPTGGTTVDPDLRFEVVGYAAYADDVQNQLVRADATATGEEAANGGVFARQVSLLVTPPAADGQEQKTSEVTGSLVPGVPADRTASMFEGLIAIEHTRGMSDQRWSDLASQPPAETGATNLLVIEVPGENVREVAAVQPQGGQPIAAGGYTITVDSISPTPPFPIITPGYEGATSSVAIVTIDPPGDEAPFQRFVYHRFPEINQDLHPTATGRPRRTDADPAIRIGYVDLTKIQVYLDERDDGSVRALARLPGGRMATEPNLAEGQLFEIDPRIGVRLGGKDGPFVQAPTPRIVPEDERAKDAIGTHRNAMLAVRVWSDGADWSRILWLPFVQYMNVGMAGETDVALPDGRQIRLAFGRIKHPFPGFALALRDFVMIPYPHSDVPRDYRSDLLVWTTWNVAASAGGASAGAGDPNAPTSHMDRFTSLNEPFLLRVPFQRRDDLPALSNMLGGVLRTMVPVQYKFSQAGWDRQGWTRTQAEADRGERPRALAGWTILGVGNNPGIYIIAFGAVLMCVGIPWAFYIKPLLVRRKKMKIKRQLAPPSPRSPRSPRSPHSPAGDSHPATSRASGGVPGSVPGGAGAGAGAGAGGAPDLLETAS